MATCEDLDGLHIYKGKAVYAVPGYPAECMECGGVIPYLPARGAVRSSCPHCGPLGAYEEHDEECPRYPAVLRVANSLNRR